MPILTFIPFLLLVLSFISVWIKRDPKVWGGLLFLSLLSGLVAGNILWEGLVSILALLILWILYDRKPNWILFIAIVGFSLCFKLRFVPGFNPLLLTPKFALGFQSAIVGLFPLALAVQIAKPCEWKEVLKGFALGCGGIALLAGVAILTGVAHWQYKLPTFLAARTFSNLFLTSIPEEAFFRGFIQKKLSGPFGNACALIFASLLFAATHIYWSPNLGVLGFTFLASLIYGGVYWYSNKIESAIMTHFVLNMIHMIFFSYHAQ